MTAMNMSRYIFLLISLLAVVGAGAQEKAEESEKQPLLQGIAVSTDLGV